MKLHALVLLLSALLLSPARLYAKEAPSVPVAAAAQGRWHPHHTAFGRVSPLRESVLRVPFRAQVATVKADVGERVRRGQALARLRSPGLAALLGKARNAEQVAGLARRRTETLARGLREKAVTRSTELEAEIELGQANSRLAEAWQALDEALLALGERPDHAAITASLKKSSVADLAARLGVLRAPFDSIVVKRPAAPGQQLPPGAPLFTVEDISSVYIEVGVPREQLSRWQGGTATVPAPDGPLTLRPVSSMPRLDPDSGLWLLLYITDNPGSNLQDGDWLRVDLSGPARTVVWVPGSSVVARNGKTYCIREQDGRLEAVTVTAGPARQGRVPVLSGLKAGDRVVTEGAYELLYRDIKELMKFVD
ncbi:MAG: efflux RND transporter periplasmic adaptor subunit [Thermodesulfobacteriota bacterium]